MASDRVGMSGCFRRQDLRWEQVDLKTASLHIRRPRTALQQRTAEWPRDARAPPASAGKPSSPFLFVSERGAPLSAPGFSRMVERAATEADLGIKAHAHMLRRACGYKLANDGIDTRAIQAYLGHRNIQNTTRYTALAP
jgi:site-specific recombinase XerD